MFHQVRIWRLFLTGLSIPISSVLAQETVNYASLGGRATDPSNAVVTGALVTARHTETNLTRTTRTDREGRFRFPYLAVGPYEIRVTYPRFTEASRFLTLTLGAAFDLPIHL